MSYYFIELSFALYFFFFFLMIRHPPRSTLFPYPTPFRSNISRFRLCWQPLSPPIRCDNRHAMELLGGRRERLQGGPRQLLRCTPASTRLSPEIAASGARSEEHTSELQSQSNLVCRLLLEQ